VFLWDSSLLGSFIGELLPYAGAGAGVGLLVGCVVVLVGGEARDNPAFVIAGSMLAGIGFTLIVALLYLALALRGD
jgi:hypothetical protein